MNKKLFGTLLLGSLLLGGTFVSCKDYDDDIENLQSQVDALKANNIIYEEKTTMNTNSVKAFLLDQLGQKGSPATITKEDLPKGLNFYQFDEMEIVSK